jgi:predicted helicase
MPNSTERKARIHYARVDEFWRKEEKYAHLDEKQHVGKVEWQEIQPDAKHNWLTLGMQDEFEVFSPLGNKETKNDTTVSAIFADFSRGVETTRDSWVYNFNPTSLFNHVSMTADAFNQQVHKWQTVHGKKDADSFVNYDETKIKWSRKLKQQLVAGDVIDINDQLVRQALYRPYARQYLYFDRSLIYLPALFPRIFPTRQSEAENTVLVVSGAGADHQTYFASNALVDVKCGIMGNSATQCFPFYTYNEDGTNRRENITDWALGQFRTHYKDKSITKWDIFHYVYALLHHPLYRERYAANLKRELPRIPFTPDFRAFADTGKQLAEIHVNYEQQPEYPLERIEKPGAQLDWRVERMKLSKDKRSLIYNDFLTLSGIPPEVFEYRLGNRSALDWIIDQYQISTDKRSGITNDPNRADDSEYIVRLIGQVANVSLETVKLVKSLAAESLLEV